MVKPANGPLEAASSQTVHAAASPCRLMRQNSRPEAAQAEISRDRRYTSSKLGRASSGSFRTSQAIYRGDAWGTGEADDGCLSRLFREPSRFWNSQGEYAAVLCIRLHASRPKTMRHCDIPPASAFPDIHDANRPSRSGAPACVPESLGHGPYGAPASGSGLTGAQSCAAKPGSHRPRAEDFSAF